MKKITSKKNLYKFWGGFVGGIATFGSFNYAFSILKDWYDYFWLPIDVNEKDLELAKNLRDLKNFKNLSDEEIALKLKALSNKDLIRQKEYKQLKQIRKINRLDD